MKSLPTTKSYLTIAGSGPSVDGRHVDIATKKRSCPSDYICSRYIHFWHKFPKADKAKPLLLYKGHCSCRKCRECRIPEWRANWKKWDAYYRQFSAVKPSLGLCAVFCAVERWSPTTIGVIGFDSVLDGHEGWRHDAGAERACMLSLVNIKDLRDDSIIRRV